MSLKRRLGLGFVFIWFAGGGLAHFAMPGFFLAIVPPWVIWPEAAVYGSGALEILGAIGLLIARTRRLAGLGLFVLVLCVTPANVYMWQHPELSPKIPPLLLALRLPVQALLLALILWCTQTQDRPRAAA